MIHNPTRPSGRVRLSPALERHYFKLGCEAAQRMSEDCAMVPYMRAELANILANLDDQDSADEVTASWGRGFEACIVERVRRSWHNPQDDLSGLLTRNTWEVSDGTEETAQRRVMGTLHAHKRGGRHES